MKHQWIAVRRHIRFPNRIDNNNITNMWIITGLACCIVFLQIATGQSESPSILACRSDCYCYTWPTFTADENQLLCFTTQAVSRKYFRSNGRQSVRPITSAIYKQPTVCQNVSARWMCSANARNTYRLAGITEKKWPCVCALSETLCQNRHTICTVPFAPKMDMFAFFCVFLSRTLQLATRIYAEKNTTA